ncbi:hypothetical protein J6590_026308 [Homalodisca vitripennis]|nr:hypothetical protein J6590_026308 [Homalodisca vitripennis]
MTVAASLPSTRRRRVDPPRYYQGKLTWLGGGGGGKLWIAQGRQIFKSASGYGVKKAEGRTYTREEKR